MEHDSLIDAVIINNALKNSEDAAEEARNQNDEEKAKVVETTTKVAVWIWTIITIISIVVDIVLLCIFLK